MCLYEKAVMFDIKYFVGNKEASIYLENMPVAIKYENAEILKAAASNQGMAGATMGAGMGVGLGFGFGQQMSNTMGQQFGQQPQQQSKQKQSSKQSSRLLQDAKTHCL